MRFKGQRPGCAPSGALRPSLVVAIMAGLIFLSACDSAPSITERATSSDNADYETLTLKAIPQSDLPPEGTRSLFDHIIKENGVLPYPFEEVIALLASYDEQGRPPLTLLIPNGRSLLKGQANFAEPRIVVAATAKPQTSAYGLDPILRGRLFLGFVEGAEEIEIISYNEHAGRYEFQLVKDYAEGKVPKLVYAKRAICTTCHVGRGPIFPTRPWEETTAQPAIQQAIIKQRGTDAPYHGAKLDNVLADAENFDAMTDIGNVVPVTQRLWIDGCGPDGEAGQACRRQMLKLAIKYLWDPASFSENDAEADQLRELQAAHWPAGGIPLDNGDILNRNPFTDKPAGLPIVNWFKGLLAGAGGDDLAAFEKLPPLRAEVDPLTPRLPKKIITAKDLDAVYSIAQLFSPNDRRLLEEKSRYKFRKIVDALDQPRMQTLYGAQPLRRVQVMRFLLAELGVKGTVEYCCLNTAGMSPPTVDGAPAIEITEGSVLEHYERYCFACHRGNPSAKLDFMNGADEKEVLARIAEVPEIRDALDYERYLGTDKAAKLMPPRKSYQRRLLDESRNAGEDHIEQMLEAVPGLFDF